ncbi:MAG: GIY-YIG nuclease family protein, partial [Patescibacteria group bacterium]
GKGAKYTKAKKITKILYTEKQKNRSLALKREAVIKKWTRGKKLQFLSRPILKAE